MANDELISSVLRDYGMVRGNPHIDALGGYRPEDRRTKLAREMTHTPSQNPSDQSILDALAIGTAPIPVVGDIMGLAADAHMFTTDPESRTPTNFGLAALGALPFIPAVSAGIKLVKDSPTIRHLSMPEHTSLKSALDAEGQVTLTHYSKKKLGKVDPGFHLTGLDSNTRAVRNRASDPDYLPRSSYMIETEADRYVKERGLGSVKNKVRISPEQLYDPRTDPLGLWDKAKTAEEVTQAEKRIRQAGFSGYFVKHPTMGNVAQVFDELPVESPLSLRYSHGELAQVPDVPQFSLPRYDAPRGIPKGTAKLMTPDVKRRLIEYANKGKEIGSNAWYNLTPLRDGFIERLGPDEGVKQFNHLVDIVAATSPRSTVYKNIVRGGFLRNQQLKGKPLDSFANLDKATGKPSYGRANALPSGKGHLAHETHQHLLADLQKGGHFESIDRPKTSSFAENLKGNQLPLTIDTHMMAALMGDPSFKKSPTKAQYKFLEDFISGVAKEQGMTPAQFQAAVWMGAGTGVADPRPYMDVFRDVVKHTAKELNMSFEEVVGGFIKGDIDLQQLMIPVASGSIIGSVLLASEEESH